MTLSSDLRRIADDLHQLGQWDSVDKVRRAAEALEWRRVDDGLPPARGLSLIRTHDGNVLVWQFDDLDTLDRAILSAPVTHWMPLPPSPERARE